MLKVVRRIRSLKTSLLIRGLSTNLSARYSNRTISIPLHWLGDPPLSSLQPPELRGPKSHLQNDMASRGGHSGGHPSRSRVDSTSSKLLANTCRAVPHQWTASSHATAPNPAELTTSIVILQLPQRQPSWKNATLPQLSTQVLRRGSDHYHKCCEICEICSAFPSRCPINWIWNLPSALSPQSSQSSIWPAS
jgi:hypothetical protein